MKEDNHEKSSHVSYHSMYMKGTEQAKPETVALFRAGGLRGGGTGSVTAK